MFKVFFSSCLIAVLFSVPAEADTSGMNASLVTEATTMNSIPPGELPMADHILVRKADRRLFLMRQDQVLRSFSIHLGLQPQGRKEFEGDYRTPEGRYFLGNRNSNSRFFLAIQVTYPSPQDEAHARHMGRRPGGAIMIHGLPSNPGKPVDYYNRADWTDGCIAVSNSDMVEIWLMTKSGLPIDIEP
jgi:murein L,D-transpeptidase YafK